MKLSTRARYGTRVLLELALHWGKGPVLLKAIAQRQQIPLPYLQQLIGPLVKAGIIKTTRGARGGISLLKLPKEVRLSEVVQILEGSTTPVACVDNPELYPRSDTCVTHDIWAEVKKAMDKVLKSTTFEDLVERQKQKWNLKQLKDH
ncbi:MAG: Rrf2 family transcriptional regulator [Deltaproteobacteria bacterium]|nr:Rrf2 family transcriptional regulator [Deltaproteobacteria bacterium]MCD6266286.1 Rrf2 family transcriptional regulator [Deltaproteobacteria bacterium]RLB22355.1 MAG: Rrf2 family transcriptional regulator [Deltaproteobacteria bacterium]